MSQLGNEHKGTTTTFAYSNHEIERILGQGENIALNLGSSNKREPIEELLLLEKRILNLKLHRSTLAEYVRSNIIPRGLRVVNKPNLCTTIPLMNTRWQEISNKCSIDFMVLTIECLDVEVKELTEESLRVKAEVIDKLGATRVDAAMADHADTLTKLQTEITERKRRKFLRDRNDYDSGRVYSWKEERNRDRLNRRVEAPPLQTGNYQRSVEEPRKLNWQRDLRERYGGNSRLPRYTSKQYYNSLTLDSSAYTSTEDEESIPSKADHYFLGARPKEGPGAIGKKNPRYPIERDAYPQRYRNNSNNQRRNYN
ncbi:uncharacterized protein LOC121393828 [Xenopus laevis]|uniref:Uncharacterized protein LOC121393828 n=1 Tax=Xenopus laevis TaxID=8355 RepID=A0A8J1KT59_XENLA|nr:uncharacterized protein LOC121393828 [Xenopus laevis]